MSKKGAKKQPAMAATLEEIMRMLMEERAQRETAMERREQVQQQMTTMHQHMESLLQVVNESTAKTKSQPHRTLDVKLVPLSAKDDIEVYLVTFERIMVAHEIRKDQWPYQLAPQLTGKAQLAFAAMPSTEAKDYDAIKAAVLGRYDVNEETYRRRFCSATKQQDETYWEQSICLLDLQNKWLRNCTSVKKMAELICLEQFYETLPVEIKT